MREAIEITLDIVLGLVFLASAIPKLRRPKSFILIVLEYRVLPPLLGRFYARILPPLELLIALLLLCGVAVRLAAVAGSFLLASFIVGVGANVVRGRHIDCGCFGGNRKRRIGWRVLLGDVGLLAMSILAGNLSNGWVTSGPWSILHVASGGGLQMVILAATSAAVVTSVMPGFTRSRSKRLADPSWNRPGGSIARGMNDGVGGQL